MALSNIFREPRREITESMVGITVFVLIVMGPLAIARYVANVAVANDPRAPYALLFVLTILGEVLGTLVLGALALLTHALGERICNALARKGLELRPTRRW
jgi:hypothetical protein